MPDGLTLRDLGARRVVGGDWVQFTVSLLISDLSYDDAAIADTAKAAVLAASVFSAVLAAAVMRYGYRYRRGRKSS